MFISRIVHAVVVFFVTFAAHQGNAAAQVNLGSGFALGHFGAPDLIKAREWLEKAAAQGHSKAQFLLLAMGAERGDAEAQVKLGWLYMLGDGVSQDEVIARTFVNGPLVVMRDENKSPVTFKRNHFTENLERQLERVNAAIDNAVLEIPDLVMSANTPIGRCGKAFINTADRRLRRIFNNRSWRLGGRMYASAWQSIPSASRPRLKLNGEPICEPDHPNMHPQMLYAMAGLSIGGDAYDVNDWSRRVVKRAFNTMINTCDLREGLPAVTRVLAKCEGESDSRIMDLVNDTKSDDQWAKWRAWHELHRLFGAEALQLMDAIRRRHKPIEQYFCTGIGLRMQRYDSDMCARVTRRLLRDGVTTLPVHDSHIGPAKHESRIRNVMADELDRVLHAMRGGSSSASSRYRQPVPHSDDELW